MSDDNVIEIDFDEEETAEELNENDVSLPAMEGTTTTLVVSVLGDNAIARSIELQFGVPHQPNPMSFSYYTNVDDAVSSSEGVHLHFICVDILSKEGVVDDSALVDAVNKIAKTPGAIVIKTSIPKDTLEKVLRIVPSDRLVYSPELTTSDSLEEILNSKVELIGGTEKSIGDYTNLVGRHSLLDREIIASNPFDIILLKMVISTHKAVFQTYWNQISEYARDGIGNFVFAKKTFNRLRDNFTETIPSYVKAKADGGYTYKKTKSFGGEYLNREVAIFAESTDKVPLLDECYNPKNIKD